MQDYEIEPECSDRMLLDVILRVTMQDDSLTIRKACREGVCESDAINIDDRNGLACVTLVKDLKEPVVLRPLPSFPAIRDLVVDTTAFHRPQRRTGCRLEDDRAHEVALLSADAWGDAEAKLDLLER